LKVAFWNIGKRLSEEKEKLIELLLEEESPDIFCVAEGTVSKENCEKLVELIKSKNYLCYYSPLSYLDKNLLLNYKYKSNGLKIFFKKDIPVLNTFSFSNQREDGRIVYLKILIKGKTTLLVFLHNFSKSGNRQVTNTQRSFIKSLNEMLKIGAVSEKNERSLIIGDFNLEPWDNVLRHPKFINSAFINHHNELNLTKKNKTYFNPISNIIHNSKEIGGTYYSKRSGWALFDYCLYSTNELNVDFKIVKSIQGDSQLINDKNESKIGIDHLPILTSILN